ncbi:uncharacterized protein [Littorina saxatilis]|uniref:uncharacterized protein n=1 Tax=Littorina saxatilis TaxID=31220 RepID=UPI0038B43ACF
MGSLSTETQGEGLWKRRTLPDILPSALDLSRIKNPPSPSKITPSPTKASPSPTADRASPWTPDGSRPLTRKHSTVWKRSSSKASIFALSPDRPGSSVTPRSAGLARTTRKFLFTLASVTMHSRRSSSSSNGQKEVRRESVGVGMSRLVGMTRGMRRTSTERMAIGGVNKLASLANFVGLKHRVFVKRKEAKSKMMWRKLKLWTKIIHVLARLLKKHAASAMNDPASPFYSHAPGIDDLLANAVDKDHYMFFDPAHFKANTQRKISQEAQRILTKPPEERTPEEIHFAMIGLRDIPQLAIFPVRMQRNFAQFGEFQSYEAKRMILKQGHHAEGYYFVLYGNVVVAVKSEDTGFAKIVVELGRGEAFGELAIVSGGSRNSSVLTKTFTELLCITKPVYETIFMTGGQKTINDRDQENFLSSLPFLRGWPVQMLSSKSSEKHVRFMYIQRNGVIMRDSNCNNWLIVVKSGSVTVLKKLVRSKPTVSSRSGMFRDTSCATAFQTFINDRREYSRWMDTRSLSLPPPLGLEEEEGDEEEDVDEHVEDEEEDDGEYEEDDFDGKFDNCF